MASNRTNNITSISEEDLSTPSSTQKYPIGTVLKLVNSTDNIEEEWIYIQAHTTLVQYQPYILDHTGTQLETAAPATGAGRVVVPQVAFTDDYYGFVQVRGKSTCKIGAETYAVGDHLQVLNAGTTAVVDGTSGSTVQLVTSFAASYAAATVAAAISVYLFGDKADVAAT